MIDNHFQAFASLLEMNLKFGNQISSLCKFINVIFYKTKKSVVHKQCLFYQLYLHSLLFDFNYLIFLPRHSYKNF